MQFDAGIAYEYLFKGCPRHCFVLVEVLSESIQSAWTLQGKALAVAKNISKIAYFFQVGHDFPLAFLSFRKIYYRYFRISTSYEGIQTSDEEAPPLWLDVSQAVSYGAQLITFVERHIFEQRPSFSIKCVGLVSDLIRDGYALYCCTLGEKKITWDTQKIALICKRVSTVGLTIISLYQKEEDPTPLLSLFLTTVFISSHFIQHPHPDRLKKIVQL